MSAPTGPEATLDAVRDALREPDAPRPDAGVERLWELASERFRGALGGADALARALRNERWAPLRGWAELTPVPLERLGDSARQTWHVVGADGATAVFTVAVAVQRYGRLAGLWALTGLVREGADP